MRIDLDKELDNMFDRLNIRDGEKHPETAHQHREELRYAFKQVAKAIRLDELSRVLGGTNTAAGIRTPAAGARTLNFDDVQYYIFNRKRVLGDQKALTPDEWFEAER